jgi:nicotinate-nucleotide--dimethylbenzimidazole phosphoribosyltransferase
MEYLNWFGLGRLKRLAVTLEQLACRSRRPVMVVFAGDNGISTESISNYAPLSSESIVERHLNGSSPTSLLLQRIGIPEIIVDVGLHTTYEVPALRQYNIRRGTRNFLHGDALEATEVLQGIEVGRSICTELYKQRFDIIGVGEIGVGDTVCAAAIAAVITGVRPELLVAQGSAAHKVIDKKNDIITRALNIRYPDRNNIIDILSRFGGLEIAALTGLIREAANLHLPVVLDGYVTSVAALLAAQTDGMINNWLIASHQNHDRGFSFILERMGLEPVFNWDVCYGEGFAAALGLLLAENTVDIWENIK